MTIGLHKVNLLYQDLNIRSKALLLYTLFAFLPMLCLTVWFLISSSIRTAESFQNNVMEIVIKNVEIMDNQLSSVMYTTDIIINDSEFMKLFQNLESQDVYSLYQTDKKVSEYLVKMLGGANVSSAYVLTRQYGFGQSIGHIMYYPYKEFYQSEIYRMMTESTSTLMWFLPYEFARMLEQRNLIGVNISYKNMFSLVRQLKPDYYDKDTGVTRRVFPMSAEPYIVINFIDDFFDKAMWNSVPVNGCEYYMLDGSGATLHTSRDDERALQLTEHQQMQLTKSPRDVMSVRIDGQDYYLFYDTMKSTGWISAALFRQAEVFQVWINSTLLLIGLSILILIGSLLLLNRLSSRIFRPLSDLVTSFEKAGKGEFIPVPSDGQRDEVGVLIEKYNEMNQNIENLIEQNYKSQMRETEAQLMALTLQLNPHFLYNSLNTINWMAILNDQTEISECIVSLSNMMKYTVESNTDTVLMAAEIEWLKSYVLLMQKRYYGVFEVRYRIESDLLDFPVPKLFLQPIVENCVLHAFVDMDEGGLIEIEGHRDGNLVLVSVSDNGIGMPAETIDRIQHSGASDTIGIPNVIKRIKLLYGAESGIHIESRPGNTKTTIILQSNITIQH